MPLTPTVHFDDLLPRDVDLEIELNSGEKIVVPIRTLSYSEQERIKRSVPDPVPPIEGVGPRGVVYNRDDPKYKRELQEAGDQRAYKLILAALRIDVPGNTEDDKLSAIREMESGILTGLLAGLQSTGFARDARILARVETFHGDGSDGE